MKSLSPLSGVVLSLSVTALIVSGCSESASENGEEATFGRFHVQAIGRLGDQPGFLSRPRAVEPIADGGFIAIDRTGRIQRFNRDGSYKLHWWLPAYDNGTPTGFDVDPRDDSLWIADTHYQRILHYTDDGRLLGQFGKYGIGPGEMIFPTDLALDPDDFTLWVSEYGNRNRIIHFTTDGKFLGEWGKIVETEADLLRPQSLRVVPKGDLVVCDAGHHRIWRFKRGEAPEPIGSWGTPGSAPGQLKYPYSISIAPDHSLYIVEYGNSRVSHFTLDGKFLGVWGGPGHALDQLFSPWGLAVDGKNDRLLIADTNNNRVLVVTPLP